MGALVENAKLIIDDLKSSWYFRLWCVFWVVCTLTVFSSLIILGKRTTKDTEHHELHMWLENASSITFPRFHIRIHSLDDSQGQVFTSKTCQHNKNLIQTQACPPFRGTTPPATNKCFSVLADGVTAKNVWGDFYTGDTFIECDITTSGEEPDGNNFLVWAEEDPNAFNFGGVNSGTAFVGPDADAWVVIEKEVLDTHEHGEVTIWHKSWSTTAATSPEDTTELPLFLVLSECPISSSKTLTMHGWVLLMLEVLPSSQSSSTQLL